MDDLRRLGAAVYSAANAYLVRKGAKDRKRSAPGKQPSEEEQEGSGTAIAVGAHMRSTSGAARAVLRMHVVARCRHLEEAGQGQLGAASCAGLLLMELKIGVQYVAAMKAWQVTVDGRRTLAEIPDRPPTSGGVQIRMQAAPVLSYLRQVLEGQLGYALPPRPFVPGTSGVGVIEAVGPGVRHLAAGQRVLLDPHLVADERIGEPAQILIGLTAMSGSAPTLGLQADWRDGTFAEVAHMPASVVTPLPAALDAMPPERVVGLSKLAVPYGGLLRAGFAPGETLVVNGASGYFGSAGVLLALALGAARVVAAGRDRTALGALAEALGPRVAAVPLTGDAVTDAGALRRAAGGPVDVGLDLVGRADSTAATNAALHALRRGGRLVLMGSASQPLALDLREMLAQDWHVMGCFMYPKEAPRRLAALAASGVIDLGMLRVRTFPLGQLEPALEAAATMRGLDLTVLMLDR